MPILFLCRTFSCALCLSSRIPPSLWCRHANLNRAYSRLTLAQLLALTATSGSSRRRAVGLASLNFNGSEVSRRAPSTRPGLADTLTEDLDLSYRAQLRGWRMQFVPHVVCPAELPVQMSGVKSQQHRWAKGSIQTAKKLLPRVLRADLPRFTKGQAVLHLTNYLVHPLMLWTALMMPWLLHVEPGPWRPTYLLTTVGSLCATLGPASLYLYAQRQLYPDWLHRLRYFPYLLIFGTGVALSNTRAIFEAFSNVRGTFVRTPKFRIEHPQTPGWGNATGRRFPGSVWGNSVSRSTVATARTSPCTRGPISFSRFSSCTPWFRRSGGTQSLRTFPGDASPQALTDSYACGSRYA